ALDVFAAGLLGRNDRDDLHVARIHDHDLVFIDKVEEAAPFRLDPHQYFRHRNDLNSAARNYGSHSDVKVDTADPRGAARIDHGGADLVALLLVELHVRPGRVALQAFRTGAAALSVGARCAGAVLLLCGGAAGIAGAVVLGGILAAHVVALLRVLAAVQPLVFSRALVPLLRSLTGLRLVASGSRAFLLIGLCRAVLLFLLS